MLGLAAAKGARGIGLGLQRQRPTFEPVYDGRKSDYRHACWDSVMVVIGMNMALLTTVSLSLSSA